MDSLLDNKKNFSYELSMNLVLDKHILTLYSRFFALKNKIVRIRNWTIWYSKEESIIFIDEGALHPEWQKYFSQSN
jgi:hypothetical protein